MERETLGAARPDLSPYRCGLAGLSPPARVGLGFRRNWCELGLMSATDISAIAARRAEIRAEHAELRRAQEAFEAEIVELDLTARVLARLEDLMRPNPSHAQHADAAELPRGALSKLKTLISARLPHRAGEADE